MAPGIGLPDTVSRPPRFDDAALATVLGIGRAPRQYDRQGRVELIGEAAQALRDGRLPGREAALFVGGALLSWLENAGSLERDFFKVTKAKSHHTPAAIWQQINAHPDEGQDTETGDKIETPSPPPPPPNRSNKP